MGRDDNHRGVSRWQPPDALTSTKSTGDDGEQERKRTEV
jgi:hypothetical protein